MGKLIPCKYCGHHVSKKARACPACGGKLKKDYPIWIAVIVLLIIGLISLMTIKEPVISITIIAFAIFLVSEARTNQTKTGDVRQKKATANQRFIPAILGRNRYYVPYGMTADEYATSLSQSVRGYSYTMHHSSDVASFSDAFSNYVEGIKELIWLYEKKKVFLVSNPNDNLNAMWKNISLTVDNFMSRAVGTIMSIGLERAEEIDSLVDEMESDEVFIQIMTNTNRAKLQKLKQESQSIKNRHYLNNLGIEHNIDFSNMDAMDVIVSMEQNLKSIYQKYIEGGLSRESGSVLFQSFKDACATSKFPLAAEVRLESLIEEYSPKFSERSIFNIIDSMKGQQFEVWCASILGKNGFENIEVTAGKGDHGVDIVAVKDGIHYAIQCKCYSKDLGNTPVQEVYAGKEMYRCQVGVVMTNRYFTAGAKALAEQTRVLLWDRDKLQSLIESAE